MRRVLLRPAFGAVALATQTRGLRKVTTPPVLPTHLDGRPAPAYDAFGKVYPPTDHKTQPMPAFGGTESDAWKREGKGWCDLCESPVPLNDWTGHAKGKRHLAHVERVELEKAGKDGMCAAPPGVRLMQNHIWCGVCKVQVAFPGAGLPRHVGGNEHKRALHRLKMEQLKGAAGSAAPAGASPPRPAAAKPAATRHRLKIE